MSSKPLERVSKMAWLEVRSWMKKIRHRRKRLREISVAIAWERGGCQGASSSSIPRGIRRAIVLTTLTPKKTQKKM